MCVCCWWRVYGFSSHRLYPIHPPTGLGLDTLEAGEREMARLLELKKARLGVLIEEARGQIRAMWDEMCCGEEERAAFAPLGVGGEGHCEDLLAVHEEEVGERERAGDLCWWSVSVCV